MGRHIFPLPEVGEQTPDESMGTRNIRAGYRNSTQLRNGGNGVGGAMMGVGNTFFSALFPLPRCGQRNPILILAEEGE